MVTLHKREYMKNYLKGYHQRPEVKLAQITYSQTFRKNHPTQWRKIQRITGKKRRSLLRAEILHLLGDKCCHCGFSDTRALQIDHINREAKHREKKNGHATSGSEMYLRYVLSQIKVGSKDYQCLCANCNWIKRHDNGEDGGKTANFK